MNKPKLAIAKNNIRLFDMKIHNILDDLEFIGGYPGGKWDLYTGGIESYGLVWIRCYFNFKIQAAAPVLILKNSPIFCWNMDAEMQKEKGMG